MPDLYGTFVDDDVVVTIVVKGEAIPMPRPRAYRVGNMARIVSNPKKHPVTAFKSHVAMMARLAIHGKDCPFKGAVELAATFVMPRTQAITWKTKPMPRLWHTTRPDFDNLIKGALDALKGIVWDDDNQICKVVIHKVIAAGDEEPRTILKVRPLNGQEV